MPSYYKEFAHYAGFMILELDSLITVQPNHLSNYKFSISPISVADTTEVAIHIYNDLGKILGNISHLNFILTNSLYDHTTVLRPGFPITRTIANFYKEKIENFNKPELIVITIEESKNLISKNFGPILLLPFCFVGQKSDIDIISTEMEELLIQSNIISQGTYDTVQRFFGIQVKSISYATINDLIAILKMKFLKEELLPLWHILDYFWCEETTNVLISSEDDNLFWIESDIVHTIFYTFDDWAQFGPGKFVPVDNLGLKYKNWTKKQRQYTSMLGMYGIQVRQVLGNPKLELDISNNIKDNNNVIKLLKLTPCLSGDFLIEEILQISEKSEIIITNYFDCDIGTITYTVSTTSADGDHLILENYYPLKFNGLDFITKEIKKRYNQGKTRIISPDLMSSNRSK